VLQTKVPDWFPFFLLIHTPKDWEIRVPVAIQSDGGCRSLQRDETQDRKTQTSTSCVIAIKTASVVSTNSEGCHDAKEMAKR
jgi:hypothetical protein